MRIDAPGSRIPSVVALVLAMALGPACAIEPGEIITGDAPAGLVPTAMLDAMERDLRQDRAQVERRLLVEARAAALEPALRDQLGAAYGGAWMSDGGATLNVGITDAALAERVRAAGAEPQLVSRTLAQLESGKATLDQSATTAGASVFAWYVDPATNSVVVVVADPAAPGVATFASRAGGGVRVVTAAERPRPLADVRGGDEFILGGKVLCSVGFAVNGGFVTAGHCGGVGTATAGSNWVAQGTVKGSKFPGNDWAWVELNGAWQSLPWVGDHAGGAIAVLGSQEAVVGSSICRSGRTTGWRCGVVQAKNVTVNYAAGPVYGTTQTSACAEGGDSGGSFIAGNQAQGVTSGGSGNCASGGTTFFQPVNPILGTFGLALKTAGGGGGAKALVSSWNGKCIDVPGSKFVDGARLQMWDCNGTAAQKWTFQNGTLRAGGLCMDVAWANPANGTAIQLVNCNGNLAQQFVLSAAGDLVSVMAGKCVDIIDWNGASGAKLQIWDCAGTANQKWSAK